MDTFKPWIKYPPLSEERLSTVANIIRRVVEQTVALYDPASGDRPWDLGCRNYSRICFALREAAKDYDWLTILNEGDPLRFTFAVGSVPIRCFHGEAEDAPTHYLITTPAEALQQNLALEFEGIIFEHEIIRIAVETGVDRLVSTITLVTMDQFGTALEGYSIPLDNQSGNVATLQPAPLDLAPPAVGPLENEEETTNDGTLDADAGAS